MAFVGERVWCNGYPGAIAEVCSGQLEGMVEIRLNRGRVCVSDTKPNVFHDGDRDPSTGLTFDAARLAWW